MFNKKPPKRFDVEHGIFRYGEKSPDFVVSLGQVFLFYANSMEPLTDDDLESGPTGSLVLHGRDVSVGAPWRYEEVSKGRVTAVTTGNFITKRVHKDGNVVLVETRTKIRDIEELKKYYESIGLKILEGENKEGDMYQPGTAFLYSL